MLDLKLIYKIVDWHISDKNDKSDQKHVGLFIPLPTKIANQFPESGKEGEDSSPSHITFLYIGDFNEELENKLVSVCRDFFSSVKPFGVKLKKPSSFNDDKGRIILHSPVKSSKLQKLHFGLRDHLRNNQINFSTKWPDFKPHVTIAYLNEEEKNKYKEVCPQGEWTVDSVWIWGTSEPYMIYLK